MKQHALEKIIAHAAGRDSVARGEIVNVKVDFAEINDLYLQTVYSFREMGGKKVWDKDELPQFVRTAQKSPNVGNIKF